MVSLYSSGAYDGPALCIPLIQLRECADKLQGMVHCAIQEGQIRPGARLLTRAVPPLLLVIRQGTYHLTDQVPRHHRIVVMVTTDTGQVLKETLYNRSVNTCAAEDGP